MTTVKTAGKELLGTYVRSLVSGSKPPELSRWALTAQNTLTASCNAPRAILAESEAKFVTIDTEDDLYALKLLLEGTAEEREARLGFPVDTLIIDRLDEFQHKLIDDRLAKDRRLTMENSDWNWITNRLTAIFEGLDELELDIIVLAAAVPTGDESAVKPDIIGNFGRKIHNYLDYALYLDRFDTPTASANGLELGDGEVLIEGDELHLEYTTKSVFTLVTEPSSEAEWVHDSTGMLPRFIDFPADFTFDDLVLAKSNYLNLLPEGSEIEIEDGQDQIVEPEPEVTEPKPTEKIEPEAPTKDTTVPGMSSKSQIEEILRGKKS